MVFIVLGSFPFIAYIKFLNGNKKIFSSDAQIRSFLKIIILSIIILSFYLFLNNNENFSFRSIFFNTISILTGTGYVNAEFDSWGSFPITIFLALMFIGGCAGSTTCGIKIFRFKFSTFYIESTKKNYLSKGSFFNKV